MSRTTDRPLTRGLYDLEVHTVTDGAHVTLVEITDHASEKTVTGIARCAPSDTFDAETGERLATVRALRRMADQHEEAIPPSCRDTLPANSVADLEAAIRKHRLFGTVFSVPAAVELWESIG